MLEIKLRKNPQKDSPYVIDLKCDTDGLEIKKRKYSCGNKIRQMISLLLAFILTAGILSIPFLVLQSYKNLSQKKGYILGARTSLISELQNKQGLYQNLVKTKQKLENIENQINQSNSLIKLISWLLPKSRTYNYLLKTGSDWVDYLLILLGDNNPQRYLVLFQNNLELRPTGGFIGFLALVDIDQGEIKKMEVPGGGSYDLNYGLNKQLLSPKPLHVINSQWEMQDCNWFPDFPSSAKKCAWFLEQSMGTSVDGVIAINLPVIVELLKVLGRIEMPDYNIVIDSNNFTFFTQTLVESKSARASGAPKQFLADLSPILIDKIKAGLQNTHQKLGIIKVILEALKTKNILLYSFDKDIQSWIENNNWAGKVQIPNPSATVQNITDYLYVNAATVNGGKSDFNIRQRINYQIDISKDGGLISTVEIIRGHIGKRLPPDFQVSQQEKDFNWLTTQPNLSYIRVYVPLGSKLLEVRGDIFDVSQIIKPIDQSSSVPDKFLQQIVKNPVIVEPSNTRITQEFNKTVFGNYIKIDPGKIESLIFRYQLPFKINDLPDSQYKLMVQKQPGIISQFSSQFGDQFLYEGELRKDLVLISN